MTTTHPLRPHALTIHTPSTSSILSPRARTNSNGNSNDSSSTTSTIPSGSRAILALSKENKRPLPACPHRPHFSTKSTRSPSSIISGSYRRTAGQANTQKNGDSGTSLPSCSPLVLHVKASPRASPTSSCSRKVPNVLTASCALPHYRLRRQLPHTIIHVVQVQLSQFITLQGVILQERIHLFTR